ncbi:MAG: hypothetical protein ACJZ6A_04735 [Candidatus Poseidoniaceae archaeon]
MDGKMKGMIMAGMMALSLILGAMAVFSNSWLTDDSEDDLTINYGLSTIQQVGDMEGMCDEMGDMMESMVEDSESECDDDELTWTASMSNYCDMMESMGDDAEGLDDCNSTVTAGTMGTIGMWGGIVCALLATLMMVLPMAGVDAMDAIPDMGQKMIVTWGAGGLMLLGMLLWYLMLPDGDSSMGLADYSWLAGAAMSIGLGSQRLIGSVHPC